MKSAVCPNDTIESSWISRYSEKPDLCQGIDDIDGEEFYQKYLLKVQFKGEYIRGAIRYTNYRPDSGFLGVY